MTSTSSLKAKVQEIRKQLLDDICAAIQSKKTMKITFTETQAPRIYFNGAWRELTRLTLGNLENSVAFGWHDERCSGNGENAFVYSAQISTETLLQFHELIYGK